MSFAKSSLKDVAFLPFWLDNPAAPGVQPPLVGRTDADLAIVGGGFTGLWAAIQAKEADRGRNVVLIEAGKVGQGASGRPGGIVSTSIMHGLHNAARLFPDEIDTLERLGQDNMRGFLNTLDRFGIDAHNRWGGELTVAVGDEHVDGIRAEYRRHREHGHNVEYLDRDAVRAQVNSPLYSAGCWSRNLSGTVHPALLAWGLKRAALELGVRLYEATPMETLRRQRSVMEIRTRNGLVRAPKVLLCTNAFAAGDRRIKQRVACLRDRILATEPLSPDQLDRIGWANRQGVYDTRTQLNYTRMTLDNRIIFGGRLAYYYGGATNIDPAGERVARPYRRLADAFHRTFPQLDDIRFTHAWSGPIALTTRMAVHFQQYHSGDAIWAGGYSGFGISASRFGARVGLAKLDRADLPELKMDFATTMPGRIPPEPLRWLGSRITLLSLIHI